MSGAAIQTSVHSSIHNSGSNLLWYVKVSCNLRRLTTRLMERTSVEEDDTTACGFVHTLGLKEKTFHLVKMNNQWSLLYLTCSFVAPQVCGG